MSKENFVVLFLGLFIHNFNSVKSDFSQLKPDLHFVLQISCSAPYSMMSSYCFLTSSLFLWQYFYARPNANFCLINVLISIPSRCYSKLSQKKCLNAAELLHVSNVLSSS